MNVRTRVTAAVVLGMLGLASVPAAEPPGPVLGTMASNAWTRIGDAEIGPRSNYGMIWAPTMKRFVLWGGGIGGYPKGGPFPFDVLSAAPGSSEWRNEYPAGTNWGPAVGACNPPVWSSYNFQTVDMAGNCRPHMRHAQAYNLYCHDAESNSLWAILQNHTMRYDFAKMTWEDLGGAAGPGVDTGETLKWGALCYDPLNKELVQFGGAHGQAQLEGGTTWLFSTEKRAWRKLEASSKILDPLRAVADGLRVAAKDLVAALRNRFHRAELADAAKADLKKRADGLVAAVGEFAGQVGKSSGADDVEKRQLGWAAADLTAAVEKLKLVAGLASVDEIKAAEETERLLLRAHDALAVEPPPRLMAPMAFDGRAKKIVMFGGDRWDHLCAETWIYDCASRRWSEQRPEVSPEPRAGHALLHLPKSGRMLLFGGYTYGSSMGYCAGLYGALPVTPWAYDVQAGSWLALDTSTNAASLRLNPGALAAVAAVSDDDLVTAIEPAGYKKAAAVWTLQAGPAAVSAGVATNAAKPGAAVRRGNCFDPDWFEDVPPADKAAVAAKLAGLPANTWISMAPPKTLQDRCWGTQVFDADRDQILHWTGGHSSHGGTDPAHYSIKLNRWSTGFAPEEPMEFLYSNTGTDGNHPASPFTGRPFLPHTYQSYCYDPISRKLIWGGVDRIWVYDPDTRDWDPTVRLSPFRAERHSLGLCPTAHGVVAWSVALKNGHGSRSGLWILKDLATNQWDELVKPATDAVLGVGCDSAGMTWDSKRDRLYLFNMSQKQKGRICYFDFKETKVGWLEPEGDVPAAAGMGREPVYMPAHDLVFLASSAGKEPPVTLIYEPEKNRWLKMDPGCEKDAKGRPIRPDHGVTTGVMWDSGRNLLWASDVRGNIFVMKFDPASAGLAPLN